MTPGEVFMLSAAARGETSLARARGLDEGDLDQLRALAAFAKGARRSDLARVILDGILALDPSRLDVHADLVLAALSDGDLDGARRAGALAEQAARAAGHAPPSLALAIARALLAGGQSADARAWLAVVVAAPDATSAERRAARALAAGLLGGPPR
jgi:hypothetical protein